LIVERDR
jgi:hypothetical protein